MVNPFQEAGAQGIVFIFVSVECPISNSYMPEYRRLEREFSGRGFSFRLVYANGDETVEAIRKQLADYACKIPAYRDPAHALVRAAKARVTPEAAVFARGRGLVYHGRIDDRYPELGKSRPTATRRDLRDALQILLEGKLPRDPAPPAVGCYIEGPR